MNNAWQQALDHFLAMSPHEFAYAMGIAPEDAQSGIKQLQEWKERGLDPQQILDGLAERLMSAAAGQSCSVN